MPLVMETGSGLSNSNAYWDYSGVSSYLTDRGYTLSQTQAAVEVAIIKATDFIDATFRFLGNRVSATQALSWPRSGVTDTNEGVAIPNNVVPIALKKTVAELAYKVLSGSILLQDLDRGGKIASASVGPVSVTYANDAPATTYYMVQGFLKGLIIETKDGVAYGATVLDVSNSLSSPRFTSGMFDS